MGPEQRRLSLAAAALAVAALVLALALGGRGGSGESFRVGVVVDCVGINRALRDAELAAPSCR